MSADLLEKWIANICQKYQKYNIDLVIANYENASHGFGLSKRNAEELFSYGIDIMTGGNHSWDKKEIFELFDSYPLIRPINYPEKSPGKGYIKLKVRNKEVAIINVLGNYTMPMSDNPFVKMDEIVDKLKKENITHIIVDIHAEATGEKQAMMHLPQRESFSYIWNTYTCRYR